MRSQTVRDQQNIWDLAVQEYGGVEGIFNIIDDNSGVDNVDHIFTNGDEIFIDDDSPANINVKNFYSSRSVVPVSGEEDLPNGDFNNDFNNDFDNIVI